MTSFSIKNRNLNIPRQIYNKSHVEYILIKLCRLKDLVSMSKF